MKDVYVGRKNKEMLIELHPVTGEDICESVFRRHYGEGMLHSGELHVMRPPEFIGKDVSYPSVVEGLNTFMSYFGSRLDINTYTNPAYDSVQKIAKASRYPNGDKGGVFVFPVFGYTNPDGSVRYEVTRPEDMDRNAEDIDGFVLVKNKSDYESGYKPYACNTCCELTDDDKVKFYDNDIENITPDTPELAYTVAKQLVKAYNDGLNGQLYEAWIYRMYTDGEPIQRVLVPDYADKGIRAVHKIVVDGVETCDEPYPHWCPPDERKSIYDVAALVYEQKYGHKPFDGQPDKTPEEIAKGNGQKEQDTGKPKKKRFFSVLFE